MISRAFQALVPASQRKASGLFRTVEDDVKTARGKCYERTSAFIQIV